jgi:riboflavin synthase
VDGVGRIAGKTALGSALKVVFQIPRDVVRFVAQKGSICVSGVSLTVNGVADDTFDVVLVPHTRERTSLDTLPVGSRVNIEIDLLARYVARLLEAGRDSASTRESLTPETTSAASDARWTERLRRSGYL